MFRLGQGVHQDDIEAVQWFRQAAEQGNAVAQYYLGVSYFEGLGLEQDGEEGRKWLETAARQGLVEAVDYLQTSAR